MTDVSYNNAWTGAIHTHKHVCYGLRKKKADDLYKHCRYFGNQYLQNIVGELGAPSANVVDVAAVQLFCNTLS